MCSGDYLYSGKDSDVELSGYTNIEGIFLQVYCIACWVKFAVVFVIIGMVIQKWDDPDYKERSN